MPGSGTRWLGVLARGAIPCAALLASAPAAETLPDPATLRTWIEEMKDSPKGPFERIRWFCADGSVLPPRPYACSERGGGIQHGTWNERALALREGGYTVGNVLAALDPEDFVGGDADLDVLGQILFERFFIDLDDGWIFRGARSYRGALQAEDEEANSRRLVLAMLADPEWRSPARFALLRETARLLPLRADDASASRVRQLALAVAEQDPGFTPLRVKIHGFPDAGDAQRVREYARSEGEGELAEQYEELAGAIDELYAARAAVAAVRAAADGVGDPALAGILRRGAADLETAVEGSIGRLAAASRLLGELRVGVEGKASAEAALIMLEASLEVETEAYALGNTLLLGLDAVTRRERLAWLGHAATVLYGTGFLSARQQSGVLEAIARIEESPRLSVGSYREELRYLARTPEWSSRWFAFHFSRTEAHLAPLEPLAHRYVQDRLRGCPLLFYGAVVDSLVRDANQLAGIEHELFGQLVGAGLRALNPGLARGVLHVSDGDEHHEGFDKGGIYLLPETTAELPPVAGILTRGEGSSLSHVQLLARNLGIPNVVVGNELLPSVRRKAGKRVVLAVSPNGVVQLASDGRRFERALGGPRPEPQTEVEIRPDLEKLDLESQELLSLDRLRASDSGRTSGPKGANLGELRHVFGKAVPAGLVIPFGVFRRLLDQPLEPGGPSVFEWMKRHYAAIAKLEDAPERRARVVREFLERLREWIRNAALAPEFAARLRSACRSQFGREGSYGVFVRSDTNVEDLPGFTGAGLNLTVPNVVGFENLLQAIRDVWASPFTERAYGWRQAHMQDPEYVFPAVVVQYSFPAEKSGVMVTADVDSGQAGWLSVAVNEGVGGAVEGQAAESLRIHAETGEVRVLAQATAPRRAVLSRRGGIERVPASGTQAVLTAAEIEKLRAFAAEVAASFPGLEGASGERAAADVEFAFAGSRLALLQIRPFVESKSARRSHYLSALDESFRRHGSAIVSLDGVPGRST